MIAKLAACILALVGTAPHFVNAPMGPQHRAESLATTYVLAAEEYDVDVTLLTALHRWESGFDSHAVSPSGAYGLGQLNLAFHRDIRGFCRRRPELCDVAVIRRSARVLAQYKRKCVTDAGAVSAYRSGKCQLPSDLTRKVLKTRRWIAARVGGMAVVL